MLTPAQQKIRQELEELHVKGLYFSEHEEPAPKREKPRRKRRYYLIGIILFIAACPLIYKGYLILYGTNIDTCLAKVLSLNEESGELIKNYLSEGQQPLPTQQMELLKKAEALEVPLSFTDYKRDFIAVMEQRLMLLSTPSPSQKSLLELNVKEEMAVESLEKALKQENIDYTLEDDGTLQIRLHSKSYLYERKD